MQEYSGRGADGNEGMVLEKLLMNPAKYAETVNIV
jgi:hypothetical protein